MANRRRGEVTLILDGSPLILCLTLGALAELEDSMGLANIGELADRFSAGKVRSADLVKILGAALRAGGTNITDQQAARMRCEGGAAALTKALVDVLRLAFDPASGNEHPPHSIDTALGSNGEASNANPA
ncbi:Phage tail tube protein, GTA-gp10 [Cohaesibacter sp. ES.047]|uniref:gene transfer agent family protein n=1 Tax=Cohaesibacter sp. ES.047 TaxID=1798205 RepID=UPI000BB77DEF|nr:gene transfer agent family protein [Cohaesibacter sp. ES.047]SNY92803.1 Phage tail tube protein, GTA-gp10 [Cohaesibacter sp. ES.047]